MNDTKMKILGLLKQPITIKELHRQIGLKWANLSLHLKDLEEEGLIIQVGKQGKSKVIQMNSYKLEQFLKEKEDDLKNLRQELTI
jgi:DNA-binding transcriptional ArsR family regulator